MGSYQTIRITNVGPSRYVGPRLEVAVLVLATDFFLSVNTRRYFLPKRPWKDI